MRWSSKCGAVLGALIFVLAAAGLAREREANGAYAERRAKLRAQASGPVVLFGYTGQENASPSYIFGQEENFYYLTGHNEPGAALVLVPDSAGDKKYDGPKEMLFLPPRNKPRERWDGIRMGFDDADISEKTGFTKVLPFSALRGELEKLATMFTAFHTLVAAPNAAGYPHAANWNAWLKQTLPQSTIAGIGPAIGAMRQLKSAGEQALLQKTIEASVDAHFEAMRVMKPGVYEYQVGARMEAVHKANGCEEEGYAPIVGAGFNSTVLHYNDLRKRIEDGDIVVLDVGASCAGYVADITRTLPANGKFTPRQREIYNIVLAAQNAAIAAVKPGMTMARPDASGGENSLYRIAYDYINTHGKDLKGELLGKYFTHGLGHHVGLQVHDAGDPNRPLEPGMIVTIEPGIYIPEENLGVRIEDMVLVTADGYKLLTARLARTIADVEKVMADAKKTKTSD